VSGASPAEPKEIPIAAGFKRVEFERMTGGIVAPHVGQVSEIAE
jgi:hypothetical protein